MIETLLQTEPSFWPSLITWLFEQQRQLHLQLTNDLRALAVDGGMLAAFGLITASFFYGIFHAAGPGHGKAILTTYLVTRKDKVSHGVKLAIAAAFCQGFVAILLVYGLIYLAGFLPRETSAAVRWSERASFLLVAAMGILLLWRGLRSMRVQFFPVGPLHAHDEFCECGHAHAPDVEQITHSTTWKGSIWVVLSIGLRPCTGAVLVLVFAKAVGLVWAGILAVAAMSLGTAIAVAGLAFSAVHLRSWAGRMAKGRSKGWLILADIMMLAGGLILLAMGSMLLSASFAPSHPLGL
jgi:ABC-type nickel/cobalt efflux system permease component RcnA